LVEIDANNIQRPIKGHLLKVLLDHILTVNAQFDPETGCILFEKTFGPLLTKLPNDVQHLYQMDDFRLHFGGYVSWGSLQMAG
jgi:hypothetical protein